MIINLSMLTCIVSHIWCIPNLTNVLLRRDKISPQWEMKCIN